MNWTRFSMQMYPYHQDSLFYFELRSSILSLASENAIEVALEVVNDGESADEVRALLRESVGVRSRLVLLVSPAEYAARVMAEADQHQIDLQFVWLDPSALGEQSTFVQSYALQAPFQFLKGFFAIHPSVNTTLVNSVYSRLQTRLSPLNIDDNIEAVAAVYDYTSLLITKYQSGDSSAQTFDRFVAAPNSFAGAFGPLRFDGASRNYNAAFRTGPLTVSNWVAGSGWTKVGSWAAPLGTTITSPSTLKYWDGTTSKPDIFMPNYVEFGVLLQQSYTPAAQWQAAVEIAIAHAMEDGLTPDITWKPTYCDIGNDDATIAARHALDLATETRAIGIITTAHPTITKTLDSIISGNGLVTISTAAKMKPGTEEEEASIKYLLRAVPSANSEALAFIALLKHYSWTRVAVIFTDDIETQASASEIIQVMRNDPAIKIITEQTIDRDVAVFNATEQLKVLQNMNVRIIICLTDPEHYPIIWKQARDMGMLNEGYVWLNSDASDQVDQITVGAGISTPTGMLSIHTFKAVPFTRLKASLQARGFSDHDIDVNDFNAITYDSTYHLIAAVQSLADDGLDYRNVSNLYLRLQSSITYGTAGPIHYDSEGFRQSPYFLYKFYNGSDWEGFGSFEEEVGIFTSDPQFLAGVRAPPVDYDDTFFIRIDVGLGLGVVIVICLVMLMIFGTFLIIAQLHWKKNVLIRASSPMFLQLILIGCLFSLSSIIPLTTTPTALTCTIRHWLFYLGFVLSYGSVLIKNWRVYRLWSDHSMKIIKISNSLLLGYLALFSIPFLLVLALWTGLDMPHPILGENTIECTSASLGWQITMFVFLLLSLFAGVAISVAARKIPNLYNETRWIAFSTYNLSFCLIIGVVVVIFLQPIDSVAFFVVSSCGIGFGFIGFWALMFFPKLQLIFLNPEKLMELSGTGSSSRTTGVNSASTGNLVVQSRPYTQATPMSSKNSSGGGKKHKSGEQKPSDEMKDVSVDKDKDTASSPSTESSSSPESSPSDSTSE